MRKISLFICLFLYPVFTIAQAVSEKLQKASQQLERDSQMRHAIFSIYVVDAKTGLTVFDKNSQLGLAGASTQKLFTSGAAFEMLGQEYRYKTELGYDGKIENGILKGSLIILGYGDPTLGSWRWQNTSDTILLDRWTSAIKEKGIKKIVGDIIADDRKFESQSTPDGWIWQDIGNYYGAGVWGVNWHENQFDLKLKSGRKVGDSVSIFSIYPPLEYNYLVNELKTAESGTGDNAYIYFPPYSFNLFIRGTIPRSDSPFTIAGAISFGPHYAVTQFANWLKKSGIKISGNPKSAIEFVGGGKKLSYTFQNLLINYSPSFDSINYWFLRRSINLYGEALVKTLAFEKTGFGSTEKGVELLKDFWSQQGIDKAAMNIIDGSGLSPQNRITTNSLVKVLEFAKTRKWYNSFYTSLPTYNGMKMKSGSIGGARSFAGYHTDRNGNEYIFAFIVNNYDGSSTAIVNKMYNLLDEMK